MLPYKESYNQEIKHPFLRGMTLNIKREDLINPNISGNKFRKLKYNLLKAKEEKYKVIGTFGGVHSNHIAAVAEAGRCFGITTFGAIRGEELELKIETIPTLKRAQDCGMKFIFLTREEYKRRHKKSYFTSLFGSDVYVVPEGGSNALGIKGCEEILTEQDELFNIICCPVGTGGTISGIINSSKSHQKVIGFSALNIESIRNNIKCWAKKENWELFHENVFGGYGKVTKELINFINDFYDQTKIPLDPIYTGKMVSRFFELLKKDYFCHQDSILIIHTGGLQGIQGLNNHLKKKNYPLIKFYDIQS